MQNGDIIRYEVQWFNGSTWEIVSKPNPDGTPTPVPADWEGEGRHGKAVSFYRDIRRMNPDLKFRLQAYKVSVETCLQYDPTNA